MKIVRLTDWRQRLDDYLDRICRLPFEYGTHDCGLFSAGAVEAMTGFDPATEFRGRYSTHAGITRILRKMGFDDHVGYVCSLFAPIHVSQADIGDLAAVDTGADGLAIGLVSGSRILAPMPGSRGLGSVSLMSAIQAFRVG